MNTIDFFKRFLEQVKQTSHWEAMRNTVEDSPWHRESSVERHTEMVITVYLERFAHARSEREQLLSLLAACFHDFGKPEAEETVEKKDQPGIFYRRYAGHEPISANEFISFICDHHELRQQLFDQGYDWRIIRKIKFMIENHLPYGLKNPQKRADLRQAVAQTLGAEEQAFYDMLRSDAAGRISDDHATKLQAVEDWITEFQALPVKEPRSINADQPTLYVLCGPSGAGKTTWTKEARLLLSAEVVCEDDYRLKYANMHLDFTDMHAWDAMTEVQQYDAAWKFCHQHPDSEYDRYAKFKYKEALGRGQNIILDRTNQTKKSRSPWICAAKEKGYKVVSVEFYISESELNRRQANRIDKRISADLVHEMIMRMGVPWLGLEVDAFEIIPQV